MKEKFNRVECKDCSGYGVVTDYARDDEGNEWTVEETCPYCYGSGEVDDEEE